EVRSAVVYATFAVILIFLPVVTLSGLAGRLFSRSGAATSLAVLASLTAALATAHTRSSASRRAVAARPLRSAALARRALAGVDDWGCRGSHARELRATPFLHDNLFARAARGALRGARHHRAWNLAGAVSRRRGTGLRRARAAA